MEFPMVGMGNGIPAGGETAHPQTSPMEVTKLGKWGRGNFLYSYLSSEMGFVKTPSQRTVT